MSWTNWVRQWLSDGKKRRPLLRKGRHLTPAKRRKVQIEALEDRTLFAVSVLSTAVGTPFSTSNGQSELSPVSSMSSNGRYTVYESSGTNLVNGQNQPANNINVFLHDSVSGTNTMISHAAGFPATAANGTSFNGAISADGSTIAFYSTANNLVQGETVPSGSVELYVYNVSTGAITLASNVYNSVAATNTGSNGTNPAIPPSPSSHWLNTLGYSAGSAALGQDINGLAMPSLSSDGKYIVYIDDATNLGAANTGIDPNTSSAETQVFLYDNNPSDTGAYGYGRNTLISHAAGQPTTSATGPNGAWATTAAISADGSTVAFTDPGTNLVAGQSSDGVSDQLYIWSRTGTNGLTAGQTVLASHAAGSATTGATIPSTLSSFFGWSADTPPSLSANGNEVAYYDAGNNLVTGQSGTASVLNVFRYTVSTNTNELVTHAFGSLTTAGNNPQNQVAGPGQGAVEADGPQISADGQFIAYANNSNNLVSATPFAGNNDNVYLYSEATQTNTLVSHAAGSATTPDAGGGTAPSMSSDGRFVAFMDLGVPATGSLSGAAGTVNVRLFDSQASATTQPAIIGQSFDSTPLPPLTGTGSNTPATVAFYASALAPTGMSADGSTIIWDGPANAASQVSGITDGNLNLDVFSNTNPAATTGSAPTFTSTNTATFTDGTAGSFQLSASGTPAATFSLGASAPSWLSINTSNQLVGTPPATNRTTSVSFTITATNTGGSTNQTFTLNINVPPLISTSSLSTQFVAGLSNPFQLTATGTGPITYTLGTGSNAPPSWVTLTSAGSLSGTAPAGTTGSFTFQVTATNSFGSDTETFTLNVVSAPHISALSTQFIAGQAGSFQLSATGTTPITYTAGTGSNAPPSWVTLTSTGALSGTAPAGTNGAFTFQVTATNSVSTDTETFTLNVIAPPHISALSTTFTAGTAGTFQLTATGTTPISYTAATGSNAPPSWVTLTSAGVLGGTAPAGTTGTFTFGVTATNSAGSDNETFTLTVNAPPHISSTLSTQFIAGQAGSYQLSATGTTPITYTAGTGSNAPPSWVTLTSAGLLGGTAPAGTTGTFTFQVIATNVAGSDTESFTLNVNAPPHISALSTTFIATQSGSFQLTATGTTPITYTAGTGSNAPPSWATLTSAGVLSGTAPAGTTGTFTFQVTATNTAGSDTETFTLNVNSVPSFTSGTSATFIVGQAGSFQLSASGTPAPTFSLTGQPSWLSINGSNQLVGTPPSGTTGPLFFTVTATNSAGSTQQPFTLNVNSVPAFTSTSSTTFTIGQAGSFQLSASGTPAPTFSLSGAPAWLSINASNQLVGTPPAGTGASVSFTVNALNSAGTTPQSFTLNVLSVPHISALSTTFIAGQAGTFQLSSTGTTPITYTAATGANAPPSWVTLTSAGLLSGTAPAGTSATFTFGVTATNAAGSDNETFTLTVNATPHISSTLSTQFIASQAGSYQLSATGTTPITFTPGTGVNAPPSWVTLSSSGLLGGTAPAGTNGAFTFQVIATNVAGSDTESFTLNVIAAPHISTLSTTFIAGQAGTFQLTSTGTTPITYTAATGANAPPSWVTLTSAGVLGGTAPAGTNGTFTFGVTATNAAGSDNETFTLTVNAPPHISTLSTQFIAGQAGTFQLAATGTTPITYTAGTGSNAPPAWVTLTSAGVLGGTAPAGTNGTFTFQVIATNVAGSDTETFNLSVIAAPHISSTLSTTFIAGQAGSYQLSSTGTTPVTYTLGTGASAPPSWVTLTSGGLLGGTAPAGTTGTFTFGVTATNAAGSDNETFSLTVNSVPAFTSTSSTTFTIGQAGSFQLSASGSPAPTFSLSGAPSWLSINASNQLVGTPPAGTGASVSFTVDAQNSAGTTPQSFTLNVTAVPHISTLSTTFIAGQAGTFQLSAAGTTPITYTAATGASAPPSWVTLTSGGLLSGTAPAGTSGTFTFGVTATNAAGSDTETFTLTVNAPPQITSLSTTFVAGQAGTFQLAANGTNPITFTAGTGVNAPPAWVTLTSSGLLGGTAPGGTTGAFTFQVTATNVAGSDTKSFTLNVNAPPHISTLSTQFIAGQAGTFQLSSTGTTPITYTAGTGANAPPAWLALSSSGQLSGTAPAGTSGTFTFQVTATNVAGSDNETFNLSVVAAPHISSALSTTFIAGQAGTYQLSSTGTTPVTYAAGTGSNAPPSWVTLTSAGVLGGTAPAGTNGTFTFQVIATNGVGSDTETFSLTVNAAPQITSLSTQFVAGAAGTFQLSANGTTPITYTAGTGANAPPAWLALSSSGQLSGTAPAGTNGSFTFQVIATNAAGSDTETFNLSVVAAPHITSSALSTMFVAGQAGSFQLTANGTNPITFTPGTGSNAPPSWVTLTSAGVLGGTAPAGTNGTFTFQVIASNGVGSDTETFTLNVNAPPQISASTLSTQFVAGQTGTFQLSSTGTTPITYTLGTGANAPPAWVTLTSGGLLGGTAPAGTTGTFTFGVTATNAAGSDNETFTLSVVSAPQISASTLSTQFVAGQPGTFQLSATGTSPITFTPGTGANAPPAWVTLSSSGLLGGTAPAGTNGTITFQVIATNAVSSDTETFTLNVIAAPHISTLSGTFTAGQSTPFQLSSTGTTPVTYTLATGANAPPAWVTLTSGGLLGGIAPAGTTGTFTFGVTATNAAGSDNETFTLNVVAPPQITTLSTTFNAGQAGTFPLAATGTTPVTFTLGTGAPAWLSIDSSNNLVGTAPAGTSGNVSFTLNATNSAGSDAEIFNLMVNPASPTDISLSNSTITAGLAVGSTVGTLGTVDPNSGQTFTYTLLASADSGDFGISGSNLTTAVNFTNATRTVFNIQVMSTDSFGLSVTKTFAITVNPPPAPTDIQLSGTTAQAAQPAGTVVGTLSATDADPNAKLTYALLGGTSQFTIVGTSLETNTVFEVGVPTTFSVPVQVTDEVGQTFDKTFDITVEPAPPTAVTLDNTTLTQAPDGTVPVGSVVGTLGTVDPNAGQNFTYSIIPATDPATGLLTTQEFTVTNNVLQTNTVIRVRPSTQIAVDVQTTDSLGLTTDQVFTITINPAPASTGTGTTTGTTTTPSTTGTTTTPSTAPTTGTSTLTSTEANPTTTAALPQTNPTTGTVAPTTGTTGIPAAATPAATTPPVTAPNGGQTTGLAQGALLPPVPTTTITGGTAGTDTSGGSTPAPSTGTTTPDMGATGATGTTPATGTTATTPATDTTTPSTGGMEEEASLSWYQPEVYTVSVTSFTDDASSYSASVSALSTTAPAPRPVMVPADELFTDLSRQRRRAADDDVDVALWHQTQEDLSRVRATLDDQVFASDEPGTGAWGLVVLGGAAALRAKPSRRIEDDEEDVLELPAE
jgi:hypothetical protein